MSGLGRVGVIALPKRAAPVLNPAIALQNQSPERVQFAINLYAIQATEGEVRPGLYMSLDFRGDLAGNLVIPLPPPLKNWIDALAADGDVLLTTDPEILALINMPAYRTVRPNRRLLKLRDGATFPLMYSLRQFMPRWLRKLANSPAEHVVSHQVAAAFGDDPRRSSLN